MQSVYSVATTVNQDQTQNIIDQGITEDFAWTNEAPRPFKAKTATLSRIGIQNFDKAA